MQARRAENTGEPERAEKRNGGLIRSREGARGDGIGVLEISARQFGGELWLLTVGDSATEASRSEG